MDYTVHGILQARILEWVAFPFSRGSSQPRIEPRSPTLQAASLPAEPPGKPKNAGVCSLSLLHQIFWPRNRMWSPSLQADSLPTELSGKPKFGTILQEFPRFRAPQVAGLDLCQQSSQSSFSLYLNLLLTGLFTALLNKPWAIRLKKIKMSICNKNFHLNSVSLDIPQLLLSR